MMLFPSEHIVHNARVLKETGYAKAAALLLKRAGCSLELTFYLLFGK